MHKRSADTVPTQRVTPGGVVPGERCVPVEMPIAISFLGLGYAVMMATPSDREDFGIGFARAERLIEFIGDVGSVSIQQGEGGILRNLELVPARHDGLFGRVRHRVGESSCGMCGIANLDQALRPLPGFCRHPGLTRQTSSQRSMACANTSGLIVRPGAVHAAALFSRDAKILTWERTSGATMPSTN